MKLFSTKKCKTIIILVALDPDLDPQYWARYGYKTRQNDNMKQKKGQIPDIK
jgi:hypothetical protein